MPINSDSVRPERMRKRGPVPVPESPPSRLKQRQSPVELQLTRMADALERMAEPEQDDAMPSYVLYLLEALTTGEPLDFHGVTVPRSVQVYLETRLLP